MSENKEVRQLEKTANINIWIDPETKNSAEELFAGFGITLADAVNIFLHMSVIEGGMPLKLSSRTSVRRRNRRFGKAGRFCLETHPQGTIALLENCSENWMLRRK